MRKKSHAPGIGDPNAAKGEDRPRQAKITDRPSKRDVTPIPKDAEEEELEKLVFGDILGFKASLGIPADDRAGDEDSSDASSHTVDVDDGPGKELRALRDDELFFIDTGPGIVATEDAPPGEAEAESEGDAPAWVDSDDERVTVSLTSRRILKKLRDAETEDVISGKEYTLRLRRQFERLHPVPDWAKQSPKGQLPDPPDDEADDAAIEDPVQPIPSLSELLQSNASYLRKSSTRLRPESLNILRLADADKNGDSKSGIATLSFHPAHPLLLSSGLDSTLRIYHIDGKQNPPAESLHISQTPIHTALFHPDGRRVFAGGRRRYFHIWDLESSALEKVTRIYGHQDTQKSMETFRLSPQGTWMALVAGGGFVNILDAASGQWVAAAKVEGEVAGVSWWHDGAGLSIASARGEVWEYEVSTRGFTGRWRDEGGVSTTAIANGGPRWVAVGSMSGIVNVYDRKASFGVGVGASGTATDPKPVKVLEQLVTLVNVLAFSPDAQVLCIASRAKKDALRMVHLPSCSVYQNWPTSRTPLGRVSAVAWAGKETGMVAVGNEAGKIRLFEIRA